MNIDEIEVVFSKESLWLLNVLLGFIMFGVALELKFENFIKLFKTPKAPLIGIVSQFILLPAITFLLVYLVNPEPSIALGMILVAACPGGNISNFMSLLAKGNAELSVSLTAFSTVFAIFLTPLNFAFWGSLNPATADLMQKISIDPMAMFKIVLLLLGVPIILGMFITHKFPKFTKKIVKPVKVISLIIFAGFVIIAFVNNLDVFINYIHLIVVLVLLHNASGLLTGYGFASLFRLPQPDRRAISIETGMQNSGLALVLIFNFFHGLGGMALIAAWWGIWHILSGLGLASFWSWKGIKKVAFTSST
ncbi:MAG: symporter [Marinilabiliales bacterium]|nr:MAG: symporter [Marinilabiliales bacterium]